jgi:hypothetical protein
VANEFIKADHIVEAANLLLQRRIVLPNVFWAIPDAQYTSTQPLDDTVTLRVPAVRTARTRTISTGTCGSSSNSRRTFTSASIAASQSTSARTITIAV